MIKKILAFLLIMWILILLGGGFMVTILGPISITGYGDFDGILSSGIKAVIAISLVIVWIFILFKMKNWVFKTEIKI